MKLANLAVLALVFVILYNLFFFRVDLGIGNGLLYLLLNLFFFITRNKNSKNLDFAFISSGISIAFAFLFSLIGNGVVQFIDYLVAATFSSTALFFYKYEPRFNLNLPNFILLPLNSAAHTIANFLNIFLENKVSQTKQNDLAPALIKGGVVALVVVGALLLLLMRGDLVFGQIINNFLSTIWERLIFSVAIFIVLINFGLSRMNKYISLFGGEVKLSIGKIHELSIILGSIIALLTFFMAIQFRYLFLPVAEVDLRQIGISSATYSEYVRAGFAELLIAATIVGGVLIYGLKYIHLLPQKQKKLLQILATVLTIENGLILISASKRLFLYTEAHGLTRAREFGFAFLIWLVCMLLVLLVGYLYKINKEIRTKVVISLTLLVILSINIVNLDELIAFNFPPTVNKEIDYSYLTSLSTDGYKSWVPAINNAQKIFSDLANKEKIEPEDYRKFTYARMSIFHLNNKVKHLQDKYGPIDLSIKDKPARDDLPNIRTWQAFNLSEYFAYQNIRDQKLIFDQIPKLLEIANQIDQRVSMEVKHQTQFDRSPAPLAY